MGNLIYVEAPDVEATFPMLFMAGGISDCWDWQSALVEELQKLDTPVIAVNPRRENFPMGDDEAGKFQIKWEYQMLRKADIISFWFPRETLCPITLFELGRHLHKRPIIGTEYGYKRAMDVRVQTEQALDPGYMIYKEIPAMANAIDKRVWEHMNWIGEGDL